MPDHFRSDVNAPEFLKGRQRALFYAICGECDQAGVELRPEYRGPLTMFAAVLDTLELKRAQIKGNTPPNGADVVDLFENFVLALSVAADFRLSAAALSHLILQGEDGESALQKELAAFENRPKPN